MEGGKKSPYRLGDWANMGTKLKEMLKEIKLRKILA